MSTNTSGGTTTSFSNTVQAKEDVYAYTEEELLADGRIYDQATDTITLDVMANDLGGKAKTLYSIDDGGSGAMSELLTSNVTTDWEATAAGNWIRIRAGVIEYRIDSGTRSTGSARDANSLAQGETIADSFVYAIRMANGTLAQAKVSVTLTGANDGPVATADTQTGHENEILAIDVLDNDSDVDSGAVLTITAASGPAGKGTVGIVGNQLQFDPGSDFDHLAAGATEVVLVNYTISDEHGATSAATLTVTVTGTNDAPVVSGAVTGGATEDGASVGLDALINASDVDDGAVLSVVGVPASLPPGVSYNAATGVFTLDPSHSAYQHLGAGATTAVTVSYGVSDGTATTPTSLSWTVTGTNDAPVAVVDTATGHENQTLTVDVLANDTDVDDGHSFTLTAVSAPVGSGSASILSNQLRFNPGTDFDHLAVGATATVVVGYTMRDEHGATSSSTLTITVTGTNDGPVAVADTSSITENQSITVDVLANDTDVDDGHAFTLLSAAAPSGKGSASVVGNQLQFNPGTDFDHLAAGVTETVVVSYTMRDEHGATSNSTLTITVTGTNDAPTVAASIADRNSNEDAPWTFTVPSGTFSDVDDGAILTFTATLGDGSALPAWLSFDAASRTFSGTPPLNFNGAIDLKVTASDGTASVSDTFRLTIDPVNDAPALTGPQASLAAGTEDVGYIVSAASLLAGFTDVDGDALAVLGLTASHGTVIDNGDGTYTVTPAANYNGTVTLSYSVVDGHGGSVAATQTFNLAAVNDPAVIGGTTSGSVTEATPADPGTPTVSGTLTAADVDNPPNSFVAVASTATASGYGTYTMAANGTWTYTVNNGNATVNALMAGAFLIDTFTVQSADGTTQTISVTINGATDAIVAPAEYTGTGDSNDYDSLLGTGTPGSPLISGTSGNDTISGRTGGSGADTINALAGNDTIHAGDGGDQVYGGADTDTIYGGSGNDSLYGQAGNDFLYGEGNNDQLYGGSGSDHLDGGDTTDMLLAGGSGADTILGGIGSDLIIGGFGADQLTGGAGDDTFKFLDVRDTNDTIVDFMVSGSDFIDLSAIDADPSTGANDPFGWGGTTPTAYGAWYAESGGNTVLYADTDGNAATAEFMVTLQGFTGWGTSYDQAIEGPPPGMIL